MAFLPDRGLTWALRGAVAVLLVGAVAFVAFYRSDQHVAEGPSVGERQVEAAEQAVVKAPNSIPARLTLAKAYKETDRPDDALRQYDQVLKVDGSNRAALIGRGSILLARNDLTGATSAYQRITKTAARGEFANADPQLEEAHYYLGVIADKQGKPKQAIAEIEAAVRIDPGDADAWYLLGTVHLKAGDPDRAVKALREALKFVPTGWCEPYTALGQAYGKLQRAPEAEYAGAMFDFCQKRPADAERRLKPLVTGPVAVDAMLGLGMIAESGTRPDEAVAWYRKVLAVDAKNFYATIALARIQAGTTAAPGHPSVPGHPAVPTHPAVTDGPAATAMRADRAPAGAGV